MKNKRFETIECHKEFMSIYSVVVDKQTGVNYLLIKSGYGVGLTPLLDENGKPIVTKQHQKE